MLELKNWVDQLPVAEDTKVLLKDLIKRREKEQQLKAMLVYLSVINGFIITVTVMWLIKLHIVSNAGMFGVIDYFSSSKASMMFLLIAVSLFIYMGSVSREHKKKKEKYENLREEVALKLSASWKIHEDTRMKDEISEVLLSQKDINIRYTTK